MTIALLIVVVCFAGLALLMQLLMHDEEHELDRAARDRLAEAGRQLVTGRLMTGEFETKVIVSSPDQAVVDLLRFFDSLYDDIIPPWSHRVRRRIRRDPVIRRAAARAVLFLQTDIDHTSAPDAIDDGLWPFESVEDFEAAKREPRLLSGRCART